MIESLKNNPVRLMAVITAVLALVAFYVPSLPVVLILAIPAAILGTGELVRAKVTPTRNVVVDQKMLDTAQPWEDWGDAE